MNKLEKTKQVELVVWLSNLEQGDELYLIHLEIYYSLMRANIKAMPSKYQQHEDRAVLQYYIPESDFDEDLIRQILYSELEDKFTKIVYKVR